MKVSEHMTNMMEAAQLQLREMLMQAMSQLVAEGKVPAEPLPAFRIEVPADKSHGDFSSNIAMASAKALHMPPRKIAEVLDLKPNTVSVILKRAKESLKKYLS